MKNGGPEKKKQVGNEISRGTQDELEILALVLSQAPVLRQIVVDRLRAAKKRHLTREELKAGRAAAAED
jgi:hypothetical protein